MCRSILAAIILALASPLPAFQIQEETVFEVDKKAGALRIISTADIDLFAPIIKSFQVQNPMIEVHYIGVTSTEIMTAITQENEAFDVVISSAMDLQIKLANDGYAAPHFSAASDRVPGWGKWRDSVFAFTQEHAAIVLSLDAFQGLDLPKTRQALITILRENPDRFRNRVGTYDIRESGLGYLFATQDARTSEVFWRLSEVFGQVGTQLYCCSSEMIDDVSAGDIAVAYNVLGSYATARADIADKIHIIQPEDFTTLMMRSALLPVNAPNTEGAGLFMDHLLTLAWSAPRSADFPFPNGTTDETANSAKLRPIRMGPGLLVFLDRFKRDQFLNAWEATILQN
ncbi:ABC transporter substrate-binding protein [Parasulfitobacter algicola]|uniref:ABC transporter substrate-binding protein n=1 Tax=Parasulfitobacter algicola TaxID=2614809 RepID=A0ABX2IRU4_9RHOB|nr:ABC transporter substrate-binding protein [Sulfitobacter algicola]NSX53497.1 ABC transporter substrate-binding protein [Sulfitobacter algicola]